MHSLHSPKPVDAQIGALLAFIILFEKKVPLA
jgi:hypothetical protein